MESSPLIDTTNRIAFSFREVSKLTGISLSTLHRWREDGTLRSVRIRRRRLVMRRELERLGLLSSERGAV